MRRVFADKEQARPVIMSLPEAEQEEKQTDQATSPVPGRAAKKSGRSQSALRWAILIFGSVGIFALLTPVLTGVSLNEWLQNADFKAAYSSSNIAYMKGMAALKAGNRAAATDALMALEVKGSEANELAVALFPALLEAKDYERLARISAHLEGSGHSQYSPAVLGGVLGKERGLTGALEFLEKNPDARQHRALILPGVFTAVAPTQLAELETLTQKLIGTEQTSAVQTVANTHAEALRFDQAWLWSAKLPEKEREQLRSSIVTQEVRIDPKNALKHLKELRPGTLGDPMRQSVALQLLDIDPQAARQAAETLTDEKLKKSTLESVENQLKRFGTLQERMAAIDKMEPARKVDALVTMVMERNHQLAQTEILPRLAALAKNNTEAARLYDDVIRYLVVTNPQTSLRQQYLAQMRNPQKRVALEEELKTSATVKAELKWGSGMASASGTGSSVSISTGRRNPR